MSMPLPVRSGNPGLNEKTFSGLPRPMAAGDRMTLQGAINKSFLLLVVLLAGAVFPRSADLSTRGTSLGGPSVLIGIVGGPLAAPPFTFHPPHPPPLPPSP